MNRDEYYQKAAEIVGHEKNYSQSMVRTLPSVDDLFRDGIKSDFLNLTDLLPKLAEDKIDRLFEEMAARDTDFFAVISTYYSEEISDDGANLHKTVQSSEWWDRLLGKHFRRLWRLPALHESDFVVTNIPVTDEIAERLKSLATGSVLQREMKRLFTRLALSLRVATGRTISQQQLFRDLDGKSVAVVGNARSLNDSDYGQDIDRHDLVIRFNRVPIVSRKSHGFRTDWIATGVPLSRARLDDLGADRLLWLSNFRRKMTADTVAIPKLYVHPKKDFEVLARNDGFTRPSTGLVALDLLRRSPCRTVDLYGFDFYASRSSSSHQSLDTAPHAFNREEDFIRAILKRDERFTLMAAQPAP